MAASEEHILHVLQMYNIISQIVQLISMTFPRRLLIFVLIHCIQNKGVIASYTWNCSEPDDNGVRYTPGILRDYGSDVLTSTTAGDVINVYRVEDLNADCYGEVTSIEYCYRYDTAVSGEAVFNWTVLIFEETNVTVLTVTKIYVLESRPSSLISEGECENSGGGKADCCDQEVIEGFDLQMNFVFGVTESAQGNTNGATLLGFFNDTSFNVQPEYVVSSLQSSKAGQNLSVGSDLIRGDEALTGLRMLWFVIGARTTSAPSPRSTTTSSPDQASTHHNQDQGINRNTSPLDDTDIIDDQRSSTTIPIAATEDNITTTSQERLDIFSNVVGGAVGILVGIVVLALVLVFTVVLFIRKLKSESRSRETRIATAQNFSTAYIKMKANDSYVPIFRQILTKDNIAYGEVGDSGGYEQVAHKEQNEGDNTEYDYIINE